MEKDQKNTDEPRLFIARAYENIQFHIETSKDKQEAIEQCKDRLERYSANAEKIEVLGLYGTEDFRLGGFGGVLMSEDDKDDPNAYVEKVDTVELS